MRLLNYLLPIIFMLFLFGCEGIQNPHQKIEDIVERIPDVELIPGAGNVTMNVQHDRVYSYFSVTIHNVEHNRYISNGTYYAWCLQMNVPINTGEEYTGVKLYSTEGDTWLNRISYMINKRLSYERVNPGLSWREIQIAMWVMLETQGYQLPADFPSTYEYDPQVVQNILNDVQENGIDFKPGAGDKEIIITNAGENEQTIGIDPTFTLDLAVNPEGAGTVTGGGAYRADEEVDLTATANEGYVFVNWTDEDGDEISNLAYFTYTMPAMDKALTANFEEEYVFVCGVSTITDIDGNVYKTVLIGDQCWMAENLKVTHYHNNGIPVAIPTGFDNEAWSTTTSGAYAIYPHGGVSGINSDAEMVDAYGKLYNWYAVSDERGLCPPGWHVPTDEKWMDLVDYVVSQGYQNQWFNSSGAGNALKSRRQVDNPLDGGIYATNKHPRWDSDDTNHGLDVFGFSGIPSGYRGSRVGNYINIGINGSWWSSTEFDIDRSWVRTLRVNNGSMLRINTDKQVGFSVRCLKDD